MVWPGFTGKGDWSGTYSFYSPCTSSIRLPWASSARQAATNGKAEEQNKNLSSSHERIAIIPQGCLAPPEKEQGRHGRNGNDRDRPIYCSILLPDRSRSFAFCQPDHSGDRW